MENSRAAHSLSRAVARSGRRRVPAGVQRATALCRSARCPRFILPSRRRRTLLANDSKRTRAWSDPAGRPRGSLLLCHVGSGSPGPSIVGATLVVARLEDGNRLPIAFASKVRRRQNTEFATALAPYREMQQELQEYITMVIFYLREKKRQESREQSRGKRKESKLSRRLRPTKSKEISFKYYQEQNHPQTH